MANLEPLSSKPQQTDSTAAPQPEAQSGETNLSLAVKSIFWLILVPAGLLYGVKLLLQSNWLIQP